MIVITKNAKRKTIAKKLKFKHALLYIEFYPSYFTGYIVKIKRKETIKNLEFDIKKKVLSFELWFFTFRFKFLVEW